MANEKRLMKAWLVREKDEFAATVVFAETRGRAKVLARCTDACEDVDFVRIEATRMKECDKCYKEGKWQMDWENPADRLVLVKECGFYCDYDAFDFGYCADCSGKEYCGLYEDRIADRECLCCVNSMSADAIDGTEVLVCFNCKGYEGKEMQVDEICENYKER